MTATSTRPRLVHVLPTFRSGAVPNIIRDLHPVIAAHFDVEIVVLGQVERQDAVRETFQRLGVAVHELGCGRWNLPRAGQRLRACLERLAPDLVHAHLGRAQILAPLCRPAGARVFTTYHNVRDAFHLGTRLALRVTDRLADGRSCVSRAVARSWFAAAPDRAAVIYNPIDLRRFQVPPERRAAIRREFAIPAGMPLIASVGRLIAAKDHDCLLRALARVRDGGIQGVRLVIAGRGPREADLRQTIDRLGLGAHVHLAGFREDIPDLVAAADVFAFPSRWEGLGLAALEAMAAGTPVAASDLAPIREYVAHGRTGLLSPPRDPAALAANLEALLSREDLRRDLGRAGQDFVRSTFGAEIIARQYLDLYGAPGAEAIRPPAPSIGRAAATGGA